MFKRTIVYQGNNLDRIFKALQIYNNWFYSDDERQKAFEVLEYEFRDQLDEAREIDELESGHSEERIEEARWWFHECQGKNDILLNALTYYEPKKWMQKSTEKLHCYMK